MTLQLRFKRGQFIAHCDQKPVQFVRPCARLLCGFSGGVLGWLVSLHGVILVVARRAFVCAVCEWIYSGADALRASSMAPAIW